MTEFHKRSWDARYAILGDEAEGLWQQLNPNTAIFGLRRPPVNLAKVPAFIRYMPDFLMHDRLVEAMGFGKDQLLKLKLDKLAMLEHWNERFKTCLFLWDSHNKRWAEMDIEHVADVADLCPIKAFPEGTPYFEVPVDTLKAQWTQID